MISCCLVPYTAQVCDEETEKGKLSKEGNIRWKRNKTKTKSTKSSSKKKSKKESKKESKKSKSKSSKKEEKKNVVEEESEEEEEGYEIGPADEEAKHAEVFFAAESTSSYTEDLERDTVFREFDTESLKMADSLPASLPKSILADSFYSDDSIPDNGDLTFEVDYCTSTPLFEALELNDWGNVLFFLRAGKFFSPGGTLINTSGIDKPETQVRTWVHCRDEAGEMMWRQLPLHAAICFAAPLVVIQRLVELYPDALACPDNFGNLPLNLAAKIHGTHSYIFQIVSVRSQRWLQTRQDSDDDQDESTVGTRERELGGVDADPNPSFDRPRTPTLFQRPISPVHSDNLPAKNGMEVPGTQQSSPYIEQFQLSYDEAYYTDEDVGTVETEYKIYRDRHSMGFDTQLSPRDVTHMGFYG